jgi:hypothetical protein
MTDESRPAITVQFAPAPATAAAPAPDGLSP